MNAQGSTAQAAGEQQHAVFLSYASDDAEAAGRICEGLRAAGIEVWYDKSELRGGDAWDATIRRQIKSCALFIPIISRHTQLRAEGYFRLEWKLAVDRSHLMAQDKAFLVPVVVDSTSEPDARVPDRFRDVQWSPLPAGEPSKAFVERVSQLLTAVAPPSGTRSSTPSVASMAAGARRSVWPMLSLAAAFVLAIVAAGAWGLAHFVLVTKGPAVVGQSPAAPPPPVAAVADSIPEKSIAVLPFADLSEKHDQEYFSDGLSEELINQLTRVSDLRVPGRTSSFYFKGKSESIATIARALHVANVLEGSVRRSGHVMRVSAQLVRADSGYDVWSQTYDENVKDVFQVQDQIASAVVEALKAKLQLTLLQGTESGASNRTTNSEAHDAYLLGEQSLKRDSVDSYKEAMRTFQRAVQLDPQYAAAYAGLAEAEIRFSDYSSGERAALQRASEAADRAVMLAPNAPEGYVARSVIRGEFLWDRTAARADIERALALDPNNAHALADYAELLGQLGLLPQALATARRAVDVDPLSGEAWETLAGILRNDGQLAAAREAILRTEQLKPRAVHSGNRLAEVELLGGHPDQAMVIAARTRFPEIMISLAAYTLGRQDESQRALDTLIRKYPDILAYQIGEAYAWRGDADQAFAWFDRACAQHDGGLSSLKVDPLVFKVRSDPRYAALLAKVGLPP